MQVVVPTTLLQFLSDFRQNREGFVGGNRDYYALLGIPRNASQEQIRRAYRESALLLHPDRTSDPEDAELFLEVGKAYEILIDPELRVEYNAHLVATEAEQASKAGFSCVVQHSRGGLLQLGEPQVHYLLLDILPSPDTPATRSPINIVIVIDRSTSMKGHRLDQVRSASLTILEGLKPGDSASIVAFSDRAEVIVTPTQARDISIARARLSLLQAGGGTEIGQGLDLGLKQLLQTFIREGVNHLVLLTDGRTYGDEEMCLQLSDRAAQQGISINGIGIGSDWSDRLIDEISTRTGGHVLFLDTPRSVAEFLQRIFEDLGRVYASRMQISGSLAQQVDLRSAFRLLPEPMPLPDILPIVLGNLGREGKIRVLLEMVIHPIGQIDELDLAHFSISGDVLGLGAERQTLPLYVKTTVSDQPDPNPPPKDILSALSFISLYRMQEKARHEAELGQTVQAARRLESLATQLMASGEKELAKAALNEAARVTRTRRLSHEGEKILKYGTRSLLLPAKTGDR
jgi:Ca-activated chloride channel family protein